MVVSLCAIANIAACNTLLQFNSCRTTQTMAIAAAQSAAGAASAGANAAMSAAASASAGAVASLSVATQIGIAIGMAALIAAAISSGALFRSETDNRPTWCGEFAETKEGRLNLILQNIPSDLLRAKRKVMEDLFVRRYVCCAVCCVHKSKHSTNGSHHLQITCTKS